MEGRDQNTMITRAANTDHEEDEKEIIERVFHLSDRNITSDDPPDRLWFGSTYNLQYHEVLTEFSEIIYTYPVCEGSIDNVKGLVYENMLKAPGNRGMDQIDETCHISFRQTHLARFWKNSRIPKCHTCFRSLNAAPWKG